MALAGPTLTPDQLYFSTYPNYANSPLPDPAGNGGLRKFGDTLPLPGVANDLGQMLTVAVPDTQTFPGSDYYEIAVQQYQEKMHADLPATTLRPPAGQYLDLRAY
jgi:hypothetical protein